MRSRVKIPLKFTYIAKLLVLAIPVSVCSYNGVVETDDLRYRTTESYQWQLIFVRSFQTANGTNGNQWQPMTPMIKLPNGTIGKTPNARNTSRFGDSMAFQNLQKSPSTKRNISQTLQHFDNFNYDCS